MEKQIERRKHKRFRGIDGLFAVLSSSAIKLNNIKSMSMAEIALKVLKSKPSKMGQIIDISKGGLAFGYIHEEDKLNGPSKITITFAEDAFYSYKMKFETISDVEMVNGDLLNTFTIKRIGLKFKELTAKQISHLDYVVRKFTVGELQPNNFFNNWAYSSMMSI